MSDSSKSEFDQYSENYECLLADPIRRRFAPSDSLFFHVRKREVLRDYFRRRRTDTQSLAYLDVGCGKGELVSLARSDFGRVAGCELSAGMLRAGNLFAKGIETRQQEDPLRIPFGESQFDLVTAVCVFHHVRPAMRLKLLREVRRVLKPGGTLAVIEHNPYNPVTLLIVRRTPVDADAILLCPDEMLRLYREAELKAEELRYFLYLPESLFQRFRRIEALFSKLPLGGQYVVFGRPT